MKYLRARIYPTNDVLEAFSYHSKIIICVSSHNLILEIYKLCDLKTICNELRKHADYLSFIASCNLALAQAKRVWCSGSFKNEGCFTQPMNKII